MSGNVYITQILLKRGNTIAASAYTGPLGEVVIDTGLDTIRVQDGVTAGGHVLATNTQISTLSNTIANLTVVAGGNYSNTNVAAYLSGTIATGNIIPRGNVTYTLGNATHQWQSLYLSSNTIYIGGQVLSVTGGQLSLNGAAISGNYSNANVEAYLPTNSTIIALTANAASQAGDIATLYANAAAQANSLAGANAAIVTANTALKSYTDTAISTAINNLIASAPATLDTLNEIAANLASSNSAIGAITNSITNTNANVTAANAQITNLWSNAAAQANSLAGANAAIVTANTAMKGYVDTVTTAWTANATAQQGSIDTLQANLGGFYTWANTNFGTSSYANADVAAYLATQTFYSNSNVAAYLVGYSGNIALDNITNTADSNISIISSKNVTTDYIYTNGTDFSTDVDIGGGTIVYGWSQRNSEQIELDLFVPPSSVSFFTGLQLGRPVIITYSTNSGNQTLSRTLTQRFTTTGQTDPNSPGGSWGRVAGRVDATLPSDQTGIVGYNFPVYSVTDSNWKFDTTGNLTTPDNLIVGAIQGPYPGTQMLQANSALAIISTGSNGWVQTGWLSNPLAPSPVATVDFNQAAGDIVVSTGNVAETLYQWTFDNAGNLSYPDGTITKGNVTYSPNTTSGLLNSFKWKFSDSTVGNDTVTLQWNLLDTTQSQWLLTTNDQGKQWVLDSDTQKVGFANVGDSVRGTVTFGTAAKGGTGNLNDIELTSPSGNVYFRSNTTSWNFGSDGNITLPTVWTVPPTSPPSGANGIRFYNGLQTTAWTGIAPIATRLSSHDGNSYIDVENTSGNIEIPGNVNISGSRLSLVNDSGFTLSNATIVQSAVSTLDAAIADWVYHQGFDIDPGPATYILDNTPIGDGIYFANIVFTDGGEATGWVNWLDDAFAVQESIEDPRPTLWIQPEITTMQKNQLRDLFTAIETAHNALEQAEKSVDLFAGNTVYTFGSDGNITMPWHGNQHDGHIFNLRGLHAMGASTAAHINGFSSVSAGNIVATVRNDGSVVSGTVYANDYYWGNGVSILSGVSSSYGNVDVASYLPADTTITGFQANVGSFYTWANANFGTSSYSNTNVAAYLTANPPSGTYSNANVASYLVSNPQTGTYSNANVVANLANFVTNIVSTANITAGNLIGTQYGNTVGTTGTFSSNVTAGNIVTTGTTSGNISGANWISANTFQVSTGIFWANGTAWSSASGGTTYSNANVASYLTAGNISVGTAGFTVLPNIVAQFTSNVNSYGQINMQNINSGTAATTEIVATANNGTDTIFFVDMGIAGNTYNVNAPNNSLGNVIYANDAYLYAQGNTSANVGGNLAIGTTTAGRVVTVFAGGINNTSTVATFANTGLTVTANITAGNITATQYGNSIGTTATYSGNITAANIITTGTYGNITNANVISANSVIVTTTVRTVPVTVATLPSASVVGAGARAFVTDATSNSFANLATGSGSYYVPVFSNGTNWYVG